MKSARRFLILLLVALGFAIPALASPGTARAASGGAPLLDSSLVQEMLRASGITDAARRSAYEATLGSWLVEIHEEISAKSSPYRKAKKLHQALHARILRHYEATADGLDAVLDQGVYNCLSASLLYGLLARAFGLEAQIVQIPSHVYVRVFVEQRRIEVESTSRGGFDLRLRPEALAEGGSDPGTFSNAGMGLSLSAVAAPPESIELEQAVGFLWHNRGRRALDRGEALAAARDFLEEAKLEPSGTVRSEAVGVYLARAFRLAYESGAFEEAYRIAEIGVRIFPGETTARDRLLAAALKQVEVDADLGRLEEAERRLDQAASTVANPADTRRLERGACPLVAAASVREQDWSRAGRMARRFAIAETDPVESQRLMKWVLRREKESRMRASENACVDPLPGFQGDGDRLLDPDDHPAAEHGSGGDPVSTD